MMQNSDLDAIYKIGSQISHYAGLRACYNAGYDAHAGINVATSIGDPSQTQTPPTSDVEATVLPP